jgi:hypothetical protein
MSTERGQVMSRNEKSVGSAGAALLGLGPTRVKINVARHEIVVCPGPVPACGTTSGLAGSWSPKLGGVEDLLRYFLKCFADSDCSLCRRLDKKRVHTTGKSLAFRCRHLSGEFLRECQKGGIVEVMKGGPCRPCFRR